MRPDNGGTMPSKSAPFTPSSILFRPRLRDQSSEVGYRLTSDHSPLMVEAPGTAPGSDRFITTAVYRHSRLAPAPLNISPEPQSKKSMQAASGDGQPSGCRRDKQPVAAAVSRSRQPRCGGPPT